MPNPDPEKPQKTSSESVGIHWSGTTHPGRVRRNNEDAFLGLTFDGFNSQYLGKTGNASLGRADFVFAVSDGMGGANFGEFASKTAVDRIAQLLPSTFRRSAGGLESGFQDVLIEAFTKIHEDLVKMSGSYEECAGMGATLSLCWFRPEWMFFAHIGDTRIYYLPKNGELSQVTHDHTQVGWMHRNGRITEREARNHPGRSSLQQALGANNQVVDPHIGAVGYQTGDRFLICSDGLIDGLWNRRINDFLTSPGPVENLAGQMVDEAVENSGRDNTTAVVIEIVPETA